MNYNSCPLPFYNFYTYSDGESSVCCGFKNGKLSPDNSIVDIFCSDAANDIRQGREAMCETCNLKGRMKPIKESISEYFPIPLAELDDAVAAGQCSREMADNFREMHKCYVNRTEYKGVHPTVMGMSFGEGCNLRCIMCFQTHKDYAVLSKSHLELIKKELPYQTAIMLTGGEPTIYPEFWDFIDYFAKISYPIQHLNVMTNLQLLTPDKIERFANIDNLLFSVNIDSATPGLYESIRRNAKHGILMENIAAINRFKEKHNKKNWRFTMGFLVMRRTLEDVKHTVKFCVDNDFEICVGEVSGNYWPFENRGAYIKENFFEFRMPDLPFSKIKNELEQAIAIARGRSEIGERQLRSVLATAERRYANKDQMEFPYERFDEIMKLSEADFYAAVQSNFSRRKKFLNRKWYVETIKKPLRKVRNLLR